ncbi:Ger(x)C family spore germination protein [Alkalihalobacterium bogoriense]|uniref:Ger(x)C family spore germination protein n=1 Tax=Alkalihalobacterium bogoriense TaxID=246272 RepID=UPI0006850D16|nr:Ger(x)C family spore germination protein [Alkalihalobacterium bogoriense]
MNLLKLCNTVLLLFLLAGCVQQNIIDEIGLIYAVGFDREEDKIRMTVSFPSFVEHGEESALQSQVMYADGNTSRAARDLLNTKSQKPLRIGQVRVLLFSDELAKEGLEMFVDTMYRDPQVGNRVLLAVVEGKTNELFLTVAEGEEDRVGEFLPDLLEQNIAMQVLPPTNLHLFLFSMYNDGRDALLPLISLEGDSVKIIGTALFDQDQYVDTLNLDESFILMMLKQSGEGGSKEFKLETEGGREYFVVEKIRSTMKRQVHSGATPSFTLQLEFKGEITDYTGNLNLQEHTHLETLEQAVEQHILQTATNLVSRFQELNIDPIGLGEKYRSTTRQWDEEQWKEMYPNMQIQIQVDVSIVQSGSIE